MSRPLCYIESTVDFYVYCMYRTLDDAASIRPWIDSSGRYRAKQEREQRERRRQILAPSDRVLLLLSPHLSAQVKDSTMWNAADLHCLIPIIGVVSSAVSYSARLLS